MFGSDLYSLLADVLIGSFALLTLGVSTWLIVSDRKRLFLPWVGIQLRRLLRRYGDDSTAGNQTREYLLFPVLAATIMGLGLAVQSIVDDLIDGDPFAFAWMTVAGQIPLETEEGYRFSALFRPLDKTSERVDPSGRQSDDKKDDESRGQDDLDWWAALLGGRDAKCDESVAYELRSLGKELLLPQKEIFAHALDPKNPSHRQFYRNPDVFLASATNADRCGVAQAIANKLYYDAANWAVTQEAYKDILRRWETQIDFLGSLSLCAFVVLSSCLAMLAIWLALNVVGWNYSEGHYRKWFERRRWLPLCSGRAGLAKAKGAIRISVMALVLLVFGRYGFIVAERNYIERALGTYASHHHFGEIILHELGCERVRQIMREEAKETSCKADSPCETIELPTTCPAQQAEPRPGS